MLQELKSRWGERRQQLSTRRSILVLLCSSSDGYDLVVSTKTKKTTKMKKNWHKIYRYSLSSLDANCGGSGERRERERRGHGRRKIVTAQRGGNKKFSLYSSVLLEYQTNLSPYAWIFVPKRGVREIKDGKERVRGIGRT